MIPLTKINYRKCKLICSNRHISGYLGMKGRGGREGLQQGTRKLLGAMSMLLP